MNEPLKHCPSCGSPAKRVWDLEEELVRCTNKDGFCHNSLYSVPINEWQNRPLEDALIARIAELEAERRWIPVSERLPDNWESVLTIDISKSTRGPVTAFYNPETSLWATHFSCDLWVTHWMPLPEPPIVYGKVCPEVQE